MFLFLQQDVEKFTDIEKLYLYLKLPSGPSSGNDKRYVTEKHPAYVDQSASFLSSFLSFKRFVVTLIKLSALSLYCLYFPNVKY